MRGNRAAAPTRGSRVEWREVRPRRVVARSADIEAMEENGDVWVLGFRGTEGEGLCEEDGRGDKIGRAHV